MVWAIRPDGVNDLMNFTSFTVPANEDFTIRMIFSFDGTNNRSFAGQSGTFNNAIRNQSAAQWDLKFDNVSTPVIFSPSLSDLTEYDVEIQRTGGATGTIDIVDTASQVSMLSSTITNPNTLTLNGFFRYGNGSFPFKGDFQHFEITSTTNNFRWNATDSSHAAGTPVLTETIAARNATGGGMATDGSVWVDLGGGGLTITLTPVDSNNAFDVSDVSNEITVSPIPITSVNAFDVTDVLVPPIIPFTPIDSSNTFDINDVLNGVLVNLSPFASTNQFDIIQIGVGITVINLSPVDSINAFDITTLLVSPAITLAPVDSSNAFDISDVSLPQTITPTPINSISQFNILAVFGGNGGGTPEFSVRSPSVTGDCIFQNDGETD